LDPVEQVNHGAAVTAQLGVGQGVAVTAQRGPVQVDLQRPLV
jgi:hypothetical protein